MISRAQLVALVSLFLLALAPAAEEKKLSVYTPQNSYSIPVTDHDGREYISVTDLLDPIGRVSLTHDGKRWKLRLEANGKTNEAEFTDRSTDIKIRGKKTSLPQPFWTVGERGYIPLVASLTLISQLTAQTAQLHEGGRRLFVGDTVVTYTAEVQKGTPSRILLHFSAPVNPTVATEPGRVRLSFSREPLISGGANPQTFDDPTVQYMMFAENNGAAELTFATTSAVLVTFADSNKTIALAAPPQAPPKPTVATAPSPTAPAPAPATSPQQTPTPTAPTPLKMVVVIDPAHGGEDPGATLTAGLFEKDITLAIARRIRTDLDQRGILGYLLRDSDTNLSFEQRAVAANGSRAVIYIAIHASTTGSGVRLYTSRVAGAVPQHGFVPWNKAQGLYVNQSHNVAASMITEFESRQVHATPFEASLRPLKNIAKPAISIEVAPPEGTVEGLSSPIYQQSVASAVGASIANLKSSLEVTH